MLGYVAGGTFGEGNIFRVLLLFPGIPTSPFFRNVCYKLKYESIVLKILLLKRDQERSETVMYFYVSGYEENVVIS
ncbi:MAG: hypothetical protein AVO38_09880 [delta proteobacterium ML8_D]|nr:MAG: hypothetical protein AVO38_09880 [delta proteobacterium ML8_D]